MRKRERERIVLTLTCKVKPNDEFLRSIIIVLRRRSSSVRFGIIADSEKRRVVDGSCNIS